MKRMLLGLLGATALFAGLAASPNARAQEPQPAAPETAAPQAPRFGARGQLIVTADRLFSLAGYTTQSITAIEGTVSTTTTDSGGSIAVFVGREPDLGTVHTIPRAAFDFTVAPHVTLGTSLAFAFDVGGTHVEEASPQDAPQTRRETRSPHGTILGFAPRIGYVVSLGSTLAFWPRAGFAFYSVSSRREETSNLGAPTTTTTTDTIFSVDLDPQLVWLPLPHVLVHAGPLVNLPLRGSHETDIAQTSISRDRSDDLVVFHAGLSVGLGVWFDL